MAACDGEEALVIGEDTGGFRSANLGRRVSSGNSKGVAVKWVPGAVPSPASCRSKRQISQRYVCIAQSTRGAGGENPEG